MPKVTVTGANGFIGKQLVKQLVEEGHEVTGVVRDRRKVDIVEALGARATIADVTKDDQISDALDGISL